MTAGSTDCRPRHSTIALVLAAGAGVRMGQTLKKQYLPLGGIPVVVRSLLAFERSPVVDGVVLVLPPGELELGRAFVQAYGLTKTLAVTAGGGTRHESVWAGLQVPAAQDADVILVHDGARPLVHPRLIERVAAAARRHGAAVPALPVTDTVKSVDDNRVTASLNRRSLRTVQTPQAFRSDWLVAAYSSSIPSDATDDAWLVEAMGHQVHVVEGCPRNFKLTTEHDFELACRLLTPVALNVGIGYDVHRMVTGRQLVLGGVVIPSELGLEGHSDADVLVHALIDALLGAAGLADIGHHFPDTDPQYRGISSLTLLERTVALLDDHRVINADATVICEAPRLAPYTELMKARLGPILRVDAAHVGIKAKTGEGLGFAGRGEGVAAWCVVLLERR
jgi:2-C-methyl-D-erythritol 4-phosphate cytidylyltransferase/2-C-methyl-D-erythritol 2,4-cyclodiphosphate synthase